MCQKGGDGPLGAAHGGAARGAAPMVSEEERRLHAVVAAGLPRRKAPVKVRMHAA